MTDALADLASRDPIIEYIAAASTAAGALISAAAVVAALWIASRNRKHQLIDRKDDLDRELQAQADTIIVEFLVDSPQTYRSRDIPYVSMARIRNHSANPILDVIFQIWTTTLDQDSLRVDYEKIVLAEEIKRIDIEFEPNDGSDWPISCRVRWRDHYGNQWVINRGDEYPVPFTGQPPQITIGS